MTDSPDRLQCTVNDWAMAHTADLAVEAAPSADSREPPEALLHLLRGRMPLAPAVVADGLYRGIGLATEQVLLGIEFLVSRSKTRAELYRRSRYSPAVAALAAESFQRDAYCLARSDVVVSADRIAVIELNVTSRLGQLLEHDLMAEYLERHPQFEQAQRAFDLRRGAVWSRLSQVIERDLQLTQGGDICVCLGQESTDQATDDFPEMLVQQFLRLQLPAYAASLSQLRLESGRLVCGGRGEIALVFRAFGVADIMTSQLSLAGLRSLVRQSRLSVIDDVAGELNANKIALTMLSEGRWLAELPPELASAMERYVPWTRILTQTRTERSGKSIDLIPHVVENRTQLVLKPGRGSRGAGVVIGNEVAQEEWDRTVAVAVNARAPWVVQDFVESKLATVLTLDSQGDILNSQRQVNYGAVLVERACAGVIRRDGPPGRNNLNAYQGSAVVTVYHPADPSL